MMLQVRCTVSLTNAASPLHGTAPLYLAHLALFWFSISKVLEMWQIAFPPSPLLPLSFNQQQAAFNQPSALIAGRCHPPLYLGEAILLWFLFLTSSLVSVQSGVAGVLSEVW